MKIEDFKVGDVYYVNGPEMILIVESVSSDSITETVVLSSFEPGRKSIDIKRETVNESNIDQFKMFLERQKFYTKTKQFKDQFAGQNKRIKNRLIERIFSFKA